MQKNSTNVASIFTHSASISSSVFAAPALCEDDLAPLKLNCQRRKTPLGWSTVTIDLWCSGRQYETFWKVRNGSYIMVEFCEFTFIFRDTVTISSQKLEPHKLFRYDAKKRFVFKSYVINNTLCCRSRRLPICS